MDHEPEAIVFCMSVRAVWQASRKGVRQCAKEIGISHGTFSRICNGNPPDLNGYFKVKKWMAKQGNALEQLKELAVKAEISINEA